MFSKKDFQAWGSQNVVLFAAVMTRIEGRKEDDLLRTYGFRSFPSMALLDAEGEAITKSIPRDLYSMRNIVAAAPAYQKLSAAVEAGEDVDDADWFLAQLGMGKLDAEKAKAALATVKLDDSIRGHAEQAVFVLEMTALSGKLRGRGVTDEAKVEVRDAVYAAFKAGKRLPAGASPEPFVDDMLVEAAKSNGDATAFFYAFDRVRASLLERQKMLASYPARMRADLEKHKDNEQMLERIKSSMKRVERMIKDGEQKVIDLDMLAKKLKQG